MSPPVSSLFGVQDIPNAGRGVIASVDISKDQLLLKSSPPAAHVIFRQYRKEVCAECFHYDRGRTLPVREGSIGKVFCSETCQNRWTGVQGEDGLRSWRALQGFTQPKRKTDSPNARLTDEKPDTDAINSAWQRAERFVKLYATSGPKSRKGPAQPIEPDLMAYFLDGSILVRGRDPEAWEQAIQGLAMDEQPYSSSDDLTAHCAAYIQLAALLAPQSVDARVCRLLVAAAAHNAFGIRAGGEDAEEYMGYAVYPEASYFNHSCAPNVRKQRVGSRWEFRAARDIAVGEECCITYLGGDEKDLNASDRRTRLRTVWGFECMCVRCKQGDA